MCNCLNPISIPYTDKNTGMQIYMLVGCGRCPLCLNKRANSWTFRLQEEFKACDDAFFVTLTYDDDHLPKDNGLRRIQKFIKRFRKNNNLPKNFKYFLVSELGGDFGRLHYHMIVFNTHMNWRRLYETIERDWHQGFIRLSYLNDHRIKYCSKYALQNLKRPIVKHTWVDKISGRVRTDKVKCLNFFFMVCSKGLGLSFLTKSMVEYIRRRNDFTIDRFIKTRSGKIKKCVIPIPVYYLKKVFDENEDCYISLKNARIQYAHDELVNYNELSDYVYCQVKKYGEIKDYPEDVVNMFSRARQVVEHAKKCKFTFPPYLAELYSPTKGYSMEIKDTYKFGTIEIHF